MMHPAPLRGLHIVELGDRIAVAACGSVLGSLGAEVTVLEADARAGSHKWMDRTIASSGKCVVPLGPGSPALAGLLSGADVVLHSSDVTETPLWERPQAQIVCDITAYGRHGPLAGVPHDDPLVQACAGLADTTGEPDGMPLIAGFPLTEGVAALYAAAGVLAALRVRSRSGRGQDVAVALYDCAFSTLTTFLPFHFKGETVSRGGNRHVLASPWNIYRARDGWLIVCTGSDEQWRRLTCVMGCPALGPDPDFAKVDGRVARREQVDRVVGQWVAERSRAECVRELQAQGIAAGPIVAARELLNEPNLAHRGLMEAREGGATMSTAIRFAAWGKGAEGGRGEPAELASPAADLRVLEIGQYTTAPLVARQLGALGAEVLKVEPPEGDATRGWAPRKDGQGYFFALSNSDKRSLCLDLRKHSDRARFLEQVARADVLVENLKPGSLARLGLGPDVLARTNPRLVYCAISGFGAESAYPGRPAFDTVIQAMSGVMDLNRWGEVPQKAGISLADILGGSFGLIATLAALIARDGGGGGASIDISMQDASAWVTQWAWRGGYRVAEYRTVRCADGYVVAGPVREPAVFETLLGDAQGRLRADVVRAFAAHAVPAAPVLTVTEVAEAAHTGARDLLISATDTLQRRWPAFRCPIELSRTPARVRSAIGPLGEANPDVAHACSHA